MKFCKVRQDGTIATPMPLAGQSVSGNGELGEGAGGRAFPRSWTPDADTLAWLAGHDWYPYVEAAKPTTQPHEQISHSYNFDGAGNVTDVWTVTDRPVDDVREDMISEVEGIYQSILSYGFDYDFGGKTATLPDGTTETAGVRTLQTDNQDRERWSATNQVATQYVASGTPNEPMRAFRTQDNARIPMTASEANACLNALQARVGRALEAMWDHKDAIRQLSTVSEIVDYDHTTGWE